jgi:hypothetical protein
MLLAIVLPIPLPLKIRVVIVPARHHLDVGDPVDGKGRIVPPDTTLTFGMVKLGHLIEHLGVIG